MPSGTKTPQFQAPDAEQEGIVGVVDLGGGGTVEILRQYDGEGCGQHVQRRTAYGLVLPSNGWRRRPAAASRPCRKRPPPRWRSARSASGGIVLGSRATASTPPRPPMTMMPSSAMLMTPECSAEHAAQRHQHQHNAIQKRVFDQQEHVTWPPFQPAEPAPHWRPKYPCRHAAYGRSRRGTAWQKHTGR